MAQAEIVGKSPQDRFRPGFRCSRFDAVVLLAGGLAAALSVRSGSWIGGLIGYVVSQFFLFCNVFRVSRVLELAWSAAFIGLMVAAQVFGMMDLTTALLSASAATIGIVAIEMRRPSYHGIGWRRINPELEAWWESRAATRRMSAS
jgi:hypothetical protein